MALLFSLMLAAPSLWAAGYIGSSDAPAAADSGSAQTDAPKKGKKRRKKGAPLPPAGDVQVGPDAEAGPLPGMAKDKDGEGAAPARPRAVPAAAPPAKGVYVLGSRAPGIYPVYDFGGRWLLLDRKKRGKKGGLPLGSEFLVIGSQGAGVFSAASSTRTWSAACAGSKHVPTAGLLLTAKKRRDFDRVGTPIMAIRLKKGKTFDVARAWFYPLKNSVKEATYQRLEAPLRQAIINDLLSGAYPIALEDEEGRRLARSPDPERIQLKIEFGSKIRVLGFKDAFLTVEGTQVSQTPRRCMRLFAGEKPVGACAEMPGALMQETPLLNFVAYDPSRRGQPFVLAFSGKPEPLWGPERWAFRLTESGPQLFLQDALDPRCREGF